MIIGYTMRPDKKPKFIFNFDQRKKFNRKTKNALLDIQSCKDKGDWNCVIRLQRRLRRVWWGLKKYI